MGLGKAELVSMRCDGSQVTKRGMYPGGCNGGSVSRKYELHMCDEKSR